MGLPDNVQNMIAEEEAILASTISSLESQLERLRKSIGKEALRARELTSQIVAATTDEDAQLLASDEAVSHGMVDRHRNEIENVEKILKRPYFARIVLEEMRGKSLERIEYKIGHVANAECRIVDWRKAPLSRLYYEYQEDDEYSETIQQRERDGRIALRNTLDIEQDTLKRVSCRYGSFEKKDGRWIELERGFRSRREGARGRLPDVLSLITAEQFQAITEDADAATLIQGTAGSGKTTVALYRLAWLLKECAQDIKANRTVIIVLSELLKSYIENSLPELSLNEVKVFTLREWSRQSLSKIAPQYFDEEGKIRRPITPCPRTVSRVKGSIAALEALEEHVNDQLLSLSEALREEIEWDKLPSGMKKLFDMHVAKSTGPLRLLQELAEGAERAVKNIPASSPFVATLDKTRTILTRLSADYQDFGGDLVAIMNNAERLLAHDESRLLDSDSIEVSCARTIENISADTLDPADEALLERLIERKLGKLTLPGNVQGKYDHIVVDEVQDFGPVELASIIGAVEDPRQLTLVGDTAQRISEDTTFPGWDTLRKYWGLGEDLSRFITLSVSHRSTLPIMRLADHILGEERTLDGRTGRIPLWFRCHTEARAVRETIDWLSKALERYPDEITAVVCKDQSTARYVYSLLEPNFGAAVRLGDKHTFLFDEGIVVTHIADVKGLEFLNVLIWNPNNQEFPESEASRRQLYVATTRAEENLCLVTYGRPSKVLPPRHSKLVRLVEQEIEELSHSSPGDSPE